MTLTPPLTVMMSLPWLPMTFSTPVSVSVPVSALVDGRGRHGRAGRGCRQVVGVDAGAAVVGVVAVADAGHEPVVAGPAVHRVVAGPAGQRIGADIAVERVVAAPRPRACRCRRRR